MWISRKELNRIKDRYEKRRDDLLNRLMSINFSEYKFTKEAPKITNKDLDNLESLSRSDQEEYEIEQKRLTDLKELEGKTDHLKVEMYNG